MSVGPFPKGLKVRDRAHPHVTGRVEESNGITIFSDGKHRVFVPTSRVEVVS